MTGGHVHVIHPVRALRNDSLRSDGVIRLIGAHGFFRRRLQLNGVAEKVMAALAERRRQLFVRAPAFGFGDSRAQIGQDGAQPVVGHRALNPRGARRAFTPRVMGATRCRLVVEYTIASPAASLISSSGREDRGRVRRLHTLPGSLRKIVAASIGSVPVRLRSP